MEVKSEAKLWKLFATVAVIVIVVLVTAALFIVVVAVVVVGAVWLWSGSRRRNFVSGLPVPLLLPLLV